MSQIAVIAARPALSWRDLAFVVAGAALLAASSYVEVPFYPVPMTLQTMVVLGLGLAGGWRRGVGSVVLFLSAGAMGMPVFAGGAAGPLVLLGPTAGYLFGFILAAGLCGLARDRGFTGNIVGAMLVALLGAAIIYVPGLLYLGSLLGWDKPILSYGFYPFVLGDLVKALLAGLGTIAISRSFRTKG